MFGLGHDNEYVIFKERFVCSKTEIKKTQLLLVTVLGVLWVTQWF